MRIEILARTDCPNRGMALAVVERVVEESGIPAQIEVIDVTSFDQAEELRLTGSPTVLVDGRDVDPTPVGAEEVTLDDRLYRTDRGLAGWPDAQWVRDALLRALGQTTANGDHASAERSSATSP